MLEQKTLHAILAGGDQFSLGRIEFASNIDPPGTKMLGDRFCCDTGPVVVGAAGITGRRVGESGVADVPGGRLGQEVAPARSRPLSVGVPPADAWRILPLNQDTCSGVNAGGPPVAISSTARKEKEA